MGECPAARSRTFWDGVTVYQDTDGRWVAAEWDEENSRFVSADYMPGAGSPSHPAAQPTLAELRRVGIRAYRNAWQAAREARWLAARAAEQSEKEGDAPSGA